MRGTGALSGICTRLVEQRATGIINCMELRRRCTQRGRPPLVRILRDAKRPGFRNCHSLRFFPHYQPPVANHLD